MHPDFQHQNQGTNRIQVAGDNRIVSFQQNYKISGGVGGGVVGGVAALGVLYLCGALSLPLVTFGIGGVGCLIGSAVGYYIGKSLTSEEAQLKQARQFLELPQKFTVQQYQSTRKLNFQSRHPDKFSGKSAQLKKKGMDQFQKHDGVIRNYLEKKKNIKNIQALKND